MLHRSTHGGEAQQPALSAVPGTGRGQQLFFSSAEQGFWHVQIKEDDAKDLPRGTRITLHLKEDAKDLADAQKLSNLIKQ